MALSGASRRKQIPCSQLNPLDKAGAYGIQDRGELIMERISGGYDNVMGLPVGLVLEVLKGIGLG